MTPEQQQIDKTLITDLLTGFRKMVIEQERAEKKGLAPGFAAAEAKSVVADTLDKRGFAGLADKFNEQGMIDKGGMQEFNRAVSEAIQKSPIDVQMLGIEGKQLIELQKISRNTQSETDQFFINNLEKATKQNQKDKTEIDEISKESIEIISKAKEEKSAIMRGRQEQVSKFTSQDVPGWWGKDIMGTEGSSRYEKELSKSLLNFPVFSPYQDPRAGASFSGIGEQVNATNQQIAPPSVFRVKYAPSMSK